MMSSILTENTVSEANLASSERLIGHVKGSSVGPTLVFVAGIHGNEPAGVIAVKNVIRTLEADQIQINGSLYAISGNLKAAEKNERFLSQDLNRMWQTERVRLLRQGKIDDELEETPEQIEILNMLDKIRVEEKGPFYFLDLHTTSGPTIPFMTVSDSFLNRRFTSQFPVPVVLGIEEYLEGAMLSYINELGYVSFGF